MPDLYDVAKDMAEKVVAAARDSGYEIKSRRAVFFVSDTLDLAGEIHTWLEAHMEPEKP